MSQIKTKVSKIIFDKPEITTNGVQPTGRQSCPIEQQRLQKREKELLKWKATLFSVKTKNDNKNEWKHYALELIDMRWIVREQSF